MGLHLNMVLSLFLVDHTSYGWAGAVLGILRMEFCCAPTKSPAIDVLCTNCQQTEVDRVMIRSSPQVSLFMQEGIQVDGARVVLPQPLSLSHAPPVGTITTHGPQGTYSKRPHHCCN